MRKMIPFLAIIVLVFSGCSGDSGRDEQAYIPVTKFDPARDAAKDIEAAIAEAKKSDRLVLLDVGGDWCIWCKKLDSFFEENQDIKEYMDRNFVVLKINYSKENKNEAVLSRYPEIPGYPHIFILDSNGELIHSQNTGELESGDYHDREKIFNFLKKYAPKSNS